MKAPLILFLFLSCLPAFSRIGETDEECKNRYGDPVGKVKEEVRFKKNGLDVFVRFHERKAASIRFSGSISIVMVQELLKANAGERKWNLELDDKAAKIWNTEDKKFKAIFAPASNGSKDDLCISYQPVLLGINRSEKETEKRKVDGF